MTRPASLAMILLILLAATAGAQTPTVSNVAPAQVSAGSSTFPLEVNGSNFLPDYNFGSTTLVGARVQWNRLGTETIVTLATGYDGPTRLTALVDAGLVATAGAAQIRVVNVDWGNPGPLVSNWVPFNIVGPLAITTDSPLPEGTVDNPYSIQLTASGGVLPYRSWSVIQGLLPPGLSLNANTGEVFGTPDEAGVYPFLIRLTDREDVSTTKQFSLTIELEGPLAILTPSRLTPGSVGAPYQSFVTASGGMPPYAWEEGGSLPPGLQLDVDNGILSGIPTQAGTYEVAIRVYDGTDAYTEKIFSLTIYPSVEFVTTSQLPDATVGQLYSQFILASGGLPAYSWALIQGGASPGIGFLSTGELRGTPQIAGEFRFTIRAMDQTGGTATREFVLTVNPAGPQITVTPPLPIAAVGTPYSLQLFASGGTAPYQWSLGQQGALPPGLSLDAVAGSIGGSPSAPGEYPFQVVLTDIGGRTDQAVFSILVNLPELAIVTASPLPEGTEGDDYSVGLAAVGGTAPYIWSVVQGPLPPGLSLSPSGSLVGVPTQPGEYGFRLKVTDSLEESAEKDFILRINESSTEPLLIVTVTPLPAGAAGTAYSEAFGASGGSAPYSWSLVAGQVPLGLTLDSSGLLSGTPTSAGTFEFTVRVTDAENSSTQGAFTLTVNLDAIPGVSIEDLPDEAEPAQQVQFGVTLASPYPTTFTGLVTLSFTPDAAVPVDDPSVQFSTGGRVVQFTIPAGEADAVFPVAGTAVQTGTVAGTIALSVQLFSGGTEVTPSPQPSRQILVARSAPAITSMRLTRTASGFEARVVGFSTPREVEQATFRFNPAGQANLQTTQLTVNVGNAFANWYQSEGSIPFGSAFEYVQTFTVQGDGNAVSSVSVTLSNPQGTSQPATAGF